MGNCFNYNKNAVEVAMIGSHLETNLSDIYDAHSKEMIKEVKDVYQQVLRGDAGSIRIIKIQWQELDETASKLLSFVLPELPSLRELHLKDNNLQ